MTNPERFHVTKLATCKRCQSNRVYWVQSNQSGKFYLIEVDANGMTDRRDFHSNYCGKQTTTQTIAGATVTAPTSATVSGNTASFNPPVQISGSGQSVVSALNALLARTSDGTDIQPSAKPSPVVPMPMPTKTSKLAEYICINPACLESKQPAFIADFTPGKPRICTECNRVAKFLKIVS